MIAGALEFTLGMQANKFLGGLKGAGSGLLAFIGIAGGVQGDFDSMWSAIERGGALNDLSNRTGIGVKALFQLQSAFDVCGVSAENVAPMMLRLQKSLTGLDEGGESTAKIFKALNLNMAQIKGMDAPAQIQALAVAFQKLGKEDAILAAGKIFGRQGAGDFMQLTRDLEGFQQALKESGGAAAVFARSAAAFDKIGDTLAIIKIKITGLWAAVAAGFAPLFQAALDKLNAIDWVAIGKKIGGVFTAVFQAFKDGTITSVIGLAFEAAFEQAGNAANRFFQGLMAAMKVSLEFYIKALPEGFSMVAGSIATLFTSGIKLGLADAMGLIADAFRLMGKTSLSKSFAGLASNLSSSADRDLTAGEASTKARSAQLVSDWGAAIMTGLKDFKTAFTGAGNILGTEKTDQLIAKIAQLQAKFGLPAGAGGPGSGGIDLNGAFGKATKSELSEVTSLEKMGAIFGGLGRGFGQDHARNTAEYTRRTAEAIERIQERRPAGEFPPASWFASID